VVVAVVVVPVDKQKVRLAVVELLNLLLACRLTAVS
jgi:hypothetical protein